METILVCGNWKRKVEYLEQGQFNKFSNFGK